MSNEDGSEDRLTRSEFAELIQHLSVQEILTIEYRIGVKWSKLFSRKNVSPQIFVCNLCVLDTSSFKNLLAHIDGRKHKLQMERVNQLYHPDYTYPKNSKKELVEKHLTKKSENTTSSSTAKNVPNKLIHPTTTEANEKPENKALQSKSKTKLPIVKPSVNLENTNMEKQIEKGNVDACNEIENNESVTVETGNADACNEKEKNENVTASKIIFSNKCVQNVGNNVEILNLDTPDTDKTKSSKVSDLEVLNVESMMKETQQLPPEKIPLTGNEIVAKANEKEANIVSITAEGSPKETKKIFPEVAEKRSMSDNKTIEIEEKKAKIVINPAAAVSSKKTYKDEDNKEKPQYQTDKIIIPSVHKSKQHKDKKSSSPSSLKTQTNDLPNFSVKSYSSKSSENDIHGILGVEYVIKIVKSRHDISPRYECGLCELVLDGFAMQKHLEGYNHRLKFCEKHFPTAIRHYRQYMQNVPESELFKVMTPVLAKLAIAIEQHHGRNLPYECYERDFNLNRHEILAKAFSCRHASEQYGPTFTHVVGSKEIDEFINNRHKYFPSSSSRTTIFDTKPGSNSRKFEFNLRDRHRHAGRENLISDVSQRVDHTHKSYMSSGLYEDMYPTVNTYNQVNNRNATQHVDDETYKLMVDDFLKGTLKGISGTSKLRDHRKRSSSPINNFIAEKRKSLSPLRQNDIWQAYRHMVDQELHNLDERFKQYRKDPETHPSYNDEWQKFWKRRKDELVTAGLDHRKYNYQPEWVRFIKIRIEELYGQEVENLKIKSRERLCLPMSNENVSDEKYQVQAPKNCSSNETITTDCNTGATTSTPSQSDNTPQVVSVLRLMTALEDSLGSLGPKIIDLFSKALQAEKTNPSHVNAIILNDDNCSLIETAKEKFKGLVITGLFEGSKKRVLKQVVNDAEALLKYAYQFRQLLVTQRSSVEFSINRLQSNASILPDSASVNISGGLKNQQSQVQGINPLGKKSQSSTSTENLLSRLDKKELASKLAASLVAQGKTDFDPQQLQQLIAVYKLIEKKKRENAAHSTSKRGCSLSDSSPSTKKALSDTLSDLLKSPSLSYANSAVPSHSSSSHLNQTDNTQFPSNISDVFQQNLTAQTAIGNYFPSNSFTSVLQNSSDNYFNNATQSTANTYGVRGAAGANQLEPHSDYGLNYTNNTNQQNSSMRDSYNNQQYQNSNRMNAQNWGWNTNMGSNQNYSMGGPNNNNYNQNSNWQNF